MIIHITSAAQAEALLRGIATRYAPPGALIFDIDPALDPCTIPLVLRRCRTCAQPGEYCGPNIWGKRMERASTYCPACGYGMETLVCVALAIQGASVIETSYRLIEKP